MPRLLEAYRGGAFPWFEQGDPVLWWSPDPRLVLPTGGVHVSRSLARRLKRRDFHVSLDTAFVDVMRACAEPRDEDGRTWIGREMLRAYRDLHAHGAAHSVEVWMDGELAGGLYGVAIGRAFFGESMFSRRTDGSKIALVVLAAQLARWGVPFIDCQVRSDHLVSLGAQEVPRAAFLAEIARLAEQPLPGAPWRLDADLAGPGAAPVATSR